MQKNLPWWEWIGLNIKRDTVQRRGKEGQNSLPSPLI